MMIKSTYLGINSLLRVFQPLLAIGMIVLAAVLVAPAQAEDILTERLEQAQLSQKQGVYTTAEQIYKDIIQGYPGTEYAQEAQKYLVILYIDCDRLPEARDVYQNLAQNFDEKEKLAESIHQIAYDRLKKKSSLQTSEAIYQFLVNDLAQDQYAVWQQTSEVINHIWAGDRDAAQTALNTLLTDFPGHKDIAQAINKIGDHYFIIRKYEQAYDAFQTVVNSWPQSEYGIWSQKSLVSTYFAKGESQKANDAIDDLLTNYANHPELERAVKMLAVEGFGQRKYAHSRYLYQYYLDHWPQGDYVFKVWKGLAISNIKLGYYDEAQTAIDILQSEFAEQEDLVPVLYQIAYDYIANGPCSGDNENPQYDKARDLYAHILHTYPTVDTLEIKTGRVRMDIILGQDEQVSAVVEALMMEFADNPDLSRTIFMIGEEYYGIAKQKVNFGETEAAKEYFIKAFNVWQNIINELPDSEFAPHANYFVAVCYRHLGLYDMAVEYWQKVADNWPDFMYTDSAHILVGAYTWILRDRGEIPAEEADPLIQIAFETVIEYYKVGIYPYVYRYALGELGRFHMEKSQWLEAIENFETFRMEFPDDGRTCWVLENLIQAYEAIGETALVIEVCEEFIEYCPDHPQINRIKAKLAELTTVMD